jgi:hypothetical protein
MPPQKTSITKTTQIGKTIETMGIKIESVDLKTP